EVQSIPGLDGPGRPETSHATRHADMTRWVLVIALAAWALAGASFAQGGLAVTKRTLAEKTSIYELRFLYPHTGNATIDREIERWAKDFAGDFKATSTNDHQPQESRYTAELKFDIVRNDPKIFAGVFQYAFDTGGAHHNCAAA